MKKVTCCFLAFWFLLPLTRVDSSEHDRFEIPSTQVIPIRDTQSDRNYELYIKLPENYSEGTGLHPVVYFTDAVWHIELLSASTAFLMEDAILVGISWQTDIDEALIEERGAHVSRFRDYSVRSSSNPEHQAKYQFGQAADHLNFIRKNVFSFVESNYRADPSRRSYFGYSLGGLFGAYILMAKPDTFMNYILGSPSLRGDIPYFTELASRQVDQGNGQNANVLLTRGDQEEALEPLIKDFAALLKKRNDPSLSLTMAVIEGSHQTAFPATGVQAVRWLAELHSEGTE